MTKKKDVDVDEAKTHPKKTVDEQINETNNYVKARCDYLREQMLKNPEKMHDMEKEHRDSQMQYALKDAEEKYDASFKLGKEDDLYITLVEKTLKAAIFLIYVLSGFLISGIVWTFVKPFVYAFLIKVCGASTIGNVAELITVFK